MSGVASSTDVLVLTGDDLSVTNLERAASGACDVALSSEGLARMTQARTLVDRAVAERTPVYGVTTGLGARVTEALDANTLADFSLQTIRGRAHAVGTPLPVDVVRASMIVRANTLLKGAAAAQPVIAEHLVACLNARVTPVVGDMASIGAGDLVWNATMALGLIGEGPMQGADGAVGAGVDVMVAAGINVPVLGPRDGLALCNNASHSAALCALGLARAVRVFEAVQASAGLTMEAFQANLSPLDPRVMALRPQPGQAEAAAGLLRLLDGSPLHADGAARRLQDPLSIRNVVQVHGAVHAALAFAQDAVAVEINGASDNPAALVEDEIILSAGAYHTPHLTNAIETINRALVHLAMTQLARLSKMMAERFTDLPTFLAAPGSHSNGFAPVMKTAEAIVSDVVHAAQPVAIWPSINADGVEDSMTATPTAARALLNAVDRMRYLAAIELLVAAQAVDLRGVAGDLGGPMQRLYGFVRDVSAPIHADRPLGRDIETLAERVGDGALAESS